jgi:NAD(P)-dependent dehydrogenase (short-subunit alcohol dehydrogenase family)
MSPEARSDRVALVTGGCAGIGKAIAARLAASCRAVVLVGRRDDAQSQEARREIEGLGCEAMLLKIDLSRCADIGPGLAPALERFGRLDVVVNNAGTSGFTGPVLETPLEEWEKLVAVNLNAVFAVSKGVLPGMIERKWGRIVNISSIAYRQCLANTASYNAAKAGVNALTRTLSKEVGRFGVTVNAVAPGLVLTDRIKNVRLPGLAANLGVTADQVMAKMVADTDTRRLTTEEDVAALVAFLASDEARNVTGQVIDVSGGF